METLPFNRILIANRGEIAIRIARAAFELGIVTVGIYSHEDRFALHRYKTDESYKVGEKGSPLAAYLDMDGIIALAKKVKIDAIHPGYGFLSENAIFAKKCADAGITFIGPPVEVLEAFGDKVTARKIAQEAALPVIPGTLEPLESFAQACDLASKLGYPVTLKAVSGGGGKGIRKVESEKELEEAFQRSQSEAKASFGRSEIYLEKTIVNPKHIEVQILADKSGQIVHLFERDCSIQRRNQKVVEVAPAIGITEKTRQSIYDQALKISRHVSYFGLGTVEFLVDSDGNPYFLEVNPRIQVEHTVTEMITGIDLMQASILVAAGVPLSDPRIGVKGQDTVSAKGIAIQCRITTEDPLNQFAPDTGSLIAYRPAAGFGIRLDEGHGTTGGEVTPYYDSLLVKLTAHGLSLEGAAAKMFRSLSEFRIRGVKHNIPLLKNIMKHQAFLDSGFNTSFLEKHTEVFNYSLPKDRATKVLRYLSEVTVNNPHDLEDSLRRGSIDGQRIEFLDKGDNKTRPANKSGKQVFAKEGSSGLVRWIKEQKKLLLTDTTMRDAHQSLFATRLRTKDILGAAPFYSQFGEDFFSLEVWGGATFDTSMRFLKEDPWDRLAKIREAIPNVLLQMLLRGDNAVGYTNYPKWVVEEFIKETVSTGLDIFRIFDCLNQPDKMKVALEAVKKEGAIAELCLCYTGDLTDPSRTKYDLNYYIKVAKELEQMGADILCIKDMAGLLKPKAVQRLIYGLKENTDLPIHLHTHDTSGAGVAMLLEAAKAGCEIVDGAISSMSGLTSQPSLNALIASLTGEEFKPNVTLEVTDELARYWEGVRSIYHAFDPGIRATSTDVYVHEIPGGQYSNFYEQAKKVGLSAHEFYELTNKYKEVNELFGDIIKVTPSSKVVGDFALLLHKQNVGAHDLLKEKHDLDFPDSVVSFFKGHMGIPYGGFPENVRKMVLGENPPAPESPQIEEDDCLELVTTKLEEILGRKVENRESLSYRLYPKVFLDYQDHIKKYGYVTSQLSTPIFFYGMKQGEEIEVDLEEGKTLYISLQGISKRDVEGNVTVFFKLNGFGREVKVLDQSHDTIQTSREKADAGNEKHVPAPMPGKVIEVMKKENELVNKGDVLIVTESMKMEYAVTARTTGEISQILVKKDDMVESGDLLIRLK
ncbi:MAG: pyruvate carboxylase [Oligoflexales bacterium]